MDDNHNRYKVLEQKNWSRKEHFDFYQKFEQPYFNICCDLNAKSLFAYCKQNEISFFNAYVYLLMKAINKLEVFRYRIVDNQIRIYDEVSVGSIQMADDQTIRFSDLPYTNNFEMFQASSIQVREDVINSNFMSELANKNQGIINTVYLTVIPWISFTGFKHASHSKDERGIPRFVFGKMRESDFSLPFSVEVHHALVDGLHIGQLVQAIQNYFDEPESFLSA